VKADRDSRLSLWLGTLAAVGLVGAVVAVGMLMAVLGGNLACLQPGGSTALAAPATEAAVKAIPPARLRLYQEAGRRFDVEWAFLASIGYQECGHGACAQVYPSGCGGPMQIALVPESACSPGPGPTIWDRYKFDADGGGADPFDPADAIFTAARMLRPVFGLHGDSYAAYQQTACNYYGSCADASAEYAEEVMARAVEYGFQGKGAPALGTEPVAVVGSPSPSCGGDATVGADANEIVRIAESQLGTPESPPGSNCNPYGPCEQWCSLFVAWVWKKAGVPIGGPTSAYGYSGSLYEWARTHEGGPFKVRAPGEPPFFAPKANGARVLQPSATPSPGDAVLYGAGPQASDHVGIVERVFSGGQITTIDGNFGDRVARNGPFLPSEAVAYGMPGPIYGYAEPPETSGSLR
jgi:hypothetical protein